VAEKPVDHATPVTPERREPGRKQHILYVDDEGQLVYLVVRMLERAGFRCTGQRQVEQALALVREAPESFDLIVTDLSMPGMSGLEFAREVLAVRADMPLIVMTGYVRSDVVTAAKELGVRDVVLKPDTIEELASLVQAELGRIATGATR
jgi:CheY-like chemotaxis protein